jgi:lipoprotein-releasing system permease protein
MNLYRYISNKFAISQKSRFLAFARFVSYLSVILGVVALLLSLAILNGFEQELRSTTTKFTSHIVIYQNNKEPIKNANEISKKIKTKFKNINDLQEVAEREGLIRSKNFIDGVLIKSYNPSNDIIDFRRYIKHGKAVFSSDTARELILGEPLQKKLAIEIGDNVFVYFIQIQDGLPKSKIRQFKIIGTYKTGMVRYDETLVLIPLGTARKLFNLEDNAATKIEVVLDDITQASSISNQIMQFLGFPFWTLTYYEIHSSLFAWIELQKEPIPLVLGIISLVAMLNIITTLIITVIEKTRSIGILRSLGVSRNGIIRIFLNQGLQIGIIGVLIGCVISFTFSFLQQQFKFIHLKSEIYFLDTLPIQISAIHYISVSILTLILVLMASILPAFIASKISPVRAIRFK